MAELGATRYRQWLAWRRFDVARLEREWVEAESAARETCEAAETTAVLGNFLSFCCNRAEALLELGRTDEAEHWLAPWA